MSKNRRKSSKLVSTRPESSGIKHNKDLKLSDFEMVKTIATGAAFGRLVLCKNKKDGKFFSLKAVSFKSMIEFRQIKHTLDEKTLLQEIHCPFIAELLGTFKNDKFFFMLFPFCVGGELFTYLRRQGRFNTDTALFFTCELVSAFEYLHSLMIIYRNLKPENILLDQFGHIKLTDFGFVKKLQKTASASMTFTLCGTPEYLSPEMIIGRGHNQSVDWWSLGIFIYEMLAGYTPFYDDDPMANYTNILRGKIEWPMSIDPVPKDLIEKLLEQKTQLRLSQAQEVKEHRWFKTIDWQDVLDGKLVPPIVPDAKGEDDTSNYDQYEEENWSDAEGPNEKEKALFEEF